MYRLARIVQVPKGIRVLSGTLDSLLGLSLTIGVWQAKPPQLHG